MHYYQLFMIIYAYSKQGLFQIYLQLESCILNKPVRSHLLQFIDCNDAKQEHDCNMTL